MASTKRSEAAIPPTIAKAIRLAEQQIEFLRGICEMQEGEERRATVGLLRPYTAALGLEPQSEYLRDDMPLTLTRTATGWRTS